MFARAVVDVRHDGVFPVLGTALLDSILLYASSCELAEPAIISCLVGIIVFPVITAQSTNARSYLSPLGIAASAMGMTAILVESLPILNVLVASAWAAAFIVLCGALVADAFSRKAY